jgi:hypothetical protein
MICKHCNKEFLYAEFGLRDFHSIECRDDYRRIYLRFKTRKIRNGEKMKVSTDPLDVNKSNPYESRVHKDGQGESVTLYEDYGGKSWYSLAKRYCCNFEVRTKEGYCVKLFAPRITFRSKCRDCDLGKALMNKTKGIRRKNA